MNLRRLTASIVTLCWVITVAIAQDTPAPTPTREELAKDAGLFIRLARRAMKWDEPMDPVHIGGPLYYVGTRGLGSYLFVTTEGNILFNTGMPESGPLIFESIRKLGFKPDEIKLLINGHAHTDHAGAFAFVKEQTGAMVAIMREDVQAIEDGGKDDFHYANDLAVMGFPPCKVDRILRDGDQIRMGEVILTAHHTPGHTRGSTTWIANIVVDGRAAVVVWPDGGGVNPGYRIARNPSYPGIAEDYRRTFHTWEMLRPDIFLGAHGEWFRLADKQARAASEGIQAWINPEEYRQFVVRKKRDFEDLFEAELGAPNEQSPARTPRDTR